MLNALTSEAAARHFEPRRRAPERHAPRTPPRPLQIHAGWRAPQSHHAKAASSPGFLADPDAGDTSDSDVDSDAFSAATTAPPVTAATVFDGWQQVAAAAADRRAIRVLRDGLRRWRRALAALAAATALAATSDGARARARCSSGAPPRRPSCSGGCRRGATRWCAVGSSRGAPPSPAAIGCGASSAGFCGQSWAAQCASGAARSPRRCTS